MLLLYLYKVERLKLDLKNLATCSSDRHKIGIKATAKKVNINIPHNTETKITGQLMEFRIRKLLLRK
jgi:hypothetical protein